MATQMTQILLFYGIYKILTQFPLDQGNHHHLCPSAQIVSAIQPLISSSFQGSSGPK